MLILKPLLEEVFFSWTLRTEGTHGVLEQALANAPCVSGVVPDGSFALERARSNACDEPCRGTEGSWDPGSLW